MIAGPATVRDDSRSECDRVRDRIAGRRGGVQVFGGLGETACNRRSVCSHVYHCGQLANDRESSSALSPLNDAVC
jgi:hypothetical protein